MPIPDNEQFWECKKTHCKMLSSKRDEFCRIRREKALEGDICYNCEGEKTMATNTKKCSNNDGKIAVKDGLCTKCYVAKHGTAPYGKKNKKEIAVIEKIKHTASEYVQTEEERFLRKNNLDAIADEIQQLRTIVKTLKRYMQ
jgi:hypothetical protein